MKKLIKKTAATALSMAGILSVVPSVLCAPLGCNYEEGKIDNYSAMITGKYFDNMEDLYNLTMVKKKFRSILEKYHYNPAPITSRKQLALFPRLETCYLGKFNGDFISTFPNGNIKTLIYTEGSFDAAQFEKVLIDNNIINENKEYTEDWKCELKIFGENPTNGCRVTFTNKNKKIAFIFAPPHSGRNAFGSFNEYNEFMERYGLYIAVARDWIVGTCYVRYATYMADYAFQNCNDLKIAIILGLNRSIGKGAFEGCKNLISVDLPRTVEFIGENAFKDCKKLKMIDIPESTTFIQKHAFENCESLRTVKLRSGVESLGEGIFKGCSALESISFPKSITSIGKSAFEGCKNLEKLAISNSVTSIGEGAFKDCENLKRISIFKSITKIENHTFENCKKFKQMEIPDSVTSIGESAFEGCENLEKINIPTSVKNIGKNAFYGCNSLRYIKFNSKGYKNIDSFMQAFNEYRANHQ